MFKSIHAENLFSWEKLDYEIRSGVSQIYGVNVDDGTSEGSGKSAVLNIMCWTLYGQIPKDAKIDEVVREGCKGGSGTVVFESGHKVHRSRKPNDLCIETPDGSKIKGKDARETQQLIIDFVGLTFEAFCQTVYFAQNYPNKFISANEAEKAKILSEVQDLTIFDQARKYVVDRIKDTKKTLDGQDREITANQAEIRRLESNAELITAHIEKFVQEREAKADQLLDRMTKTKQNIADLEQVLEQTDTQAIQADIEYIDANITALNEKKVEAATTVKLAEKAQAEYTKARRHLDYIASKIDREKADKSRTRERIKTSEDKTAKLVAKIEALEADDTNPGNCPTCGQTASESMLAKHRAHIEKQLAEAVSNLQALDAEIKEYQEDLINYDKTIKSLEEDSKEAVAECEAAKEIPPTHEAEATLTEIAQKIQKFTQERKELQVELNSLTRTEAELETHRKSLKEISAAIKELRASNCDEDLAKLEAVDQELKDCAEKATRFEKARQSTVDVLDNLEILKVGFKEVKQYVFQSLLAELSNKATAMAAELFEVPVRIQFTNEDEESGVSKIRTEVTLDGCSRGLGLLSGGQYSRVALAVNLALSDIVGQRASKPMNLTILDEPFQNFSLTSMEKAVQLLERRGGNVILIEHNDLIKQIVHNTFEVELRDGVTRAVS